MSRTFSAKSPLQLVTAVTIVFMCLNTFLPLNFSPIEAEATEYPFKLKITLEKTTYKLGEPVNVTWTLTNIGEENVTLYSSRDLSGFLVRDENFIHVYRQGNRVWLVIHPSPPIATGENWTSTEVWRQVYDDQILKLQNAYYVLKKVPPGTYYVSGYSWIPTYNIELETPAVRVSVG
ncbi:hypothetical protein GTO27_12640 [Candidatus Bathyarchaeota archaeon]|nr:hypothetical protein [Candidatus Bathyarchaeota archaeon]